MILNLQKEKIFYYTEVIENPNLLINLIEKNDLILEDGLQITKWQNWQSSDGSYVFGKQKMTDPRLKKTKETSEIIQIISNAITKASKDYAEKNNIDIGYLMPISISKYEKNKEMGPHVDSYGDERSPVISVVLYLNDDYEGGELEFKNQNVVIKPEAGSIVIFPSIEPYYHASLPIKNGIKYMTPGFWYNL
jgi:predicted 2-oxoglutarate/Fe(II)-dependent dioxygenase YbiX